MNTEQRLDALRTATLERIDRNDRWSKVLIAIAFLTEIAGLGAYLLLMDFEDRTHWLILLAAVLVYLTLAWWTWGLAAHANHGALRVLRSLDLLHEELREEGRLRTQDHDAT